MYVLRQASLKSANHDCIKNVPARGDGWDASEAPPAYVRRILLLKRGHAASNNKTDIQLSIFPNPCSFSQKRAANVASAYAHHLPTSQTFS
jgi:hypothetical protein